MKRTYELKSFKGWRIKQFVINDNSQYLKADSIDFVMYNEDYEKSLTLTLTNMKICKILEYGISEDRYTLSDFACIVDEYKEYSDSEIYEVTVEHSADIIESIKISLENDDIVFEGDMTLTFDVAEMSNFPENLVDKFVNVENEEDDLTIIHKHNPVVADKDEVDKAMESLEQFSSEENMDYNERFENFIAGYKKLCKKYKFMVDGVGENSPFSVDLKGVKKKKFKKLLKKNIKNIKNF